jgi:large subunit ribosomal protein L6
MSRIGKQPITIPQGVNVEVAGSQISVQGPKGKLDYRLGHGVAVEKEDGQIRVVRRSSDKQAKANYGSTRAHLNNMVTGVTTGWKRSLELSGVGFNAKVDGKKLTLVVGYSHDVTIEIPQEVNCTATKTSVMLESANKDLLGTIAAKIRQVHPPEPYLGKGIKYSDETVRRKAGKTGKK